MRVLVTGNLGYIGPAVVRRLREAGHHVTGVDVGWYVHDYAGEPVWPDKQYFADIRKPADAWFLGIDAVVHLAGLSNDPIGELDPEVTSDVNYVGTAEMLLAGARNVVVSSCSVYGANSAIATEDTPVNPLTAYARAKADVDRYLGLFDGYLGLTNWASLRLGTVWGYSPGHRLDLVVNRMVHDATFGAITATGNAARPLVHVEDVADAVLTFVENDAQGIYNIVGENIRMYDLADRVALASGKRNLRVAKLAGSADARDYMASGAKALARANWLPQHRLADSLPDLFVHTHALPAGRLYERLPIARKHLEKIAA